MRQERLARRRPLPRQQLSPHDVYAVGGLDGGDPDDTYPSVLVVDEGRPAELLIGRARLRRHLRLLPDRAVQAYRVSPWDEEARAAIAALDGWKTLEQLGAGLSALHASGMPLSQIQAVVQGAGHFSDIGRTISVYRESPALFAMADKSRERLSLGHILKLARIAPEAREARARDVIAKGLSVARLVQLLRAPNDLPDPDVASLASRLSAALGTNIELAGTAHEGEVRLAWHTIEELQGLLARWTRQSQEGGTGNVETGPRRWLAIQYASAEEFDQLFGRLVNENDRLGP